MKKIILIFCFLLSTPALFAQELAQYNTGTLFDSFENPSQRSFIPDTSRQYATNFFFPNFNGNIYLTGDAQQTAKNKLFNKHYDNSALVVGPGDHFNYINGNANVYALMFKWFTSLNGNVEVGAFIQGKGFARGVFTDESAALLNGSASFPQNNYDNVFNSHYHYQTYNQFGATYREQITKRLSFGFKLGVVSGMGDENVNFTQTSIVFNREAQTASLHIEGTNEKAGYSKLPFSNPGLTSSLGITYKTPDKFIIQADLKDLGFIHWNKNAETYYLNQTFQLDDLTPDNRSSVIYDTIKRHLTQGVQVRHAYTTPLDGTAELSVSKSFLIDEDLGITYAPTLVAQKELFYTGFRGALVSPVQYKNYSLTVVTAYDDMRLFDFGLQFMVKSGNAEFFIGSDRIGQSLSLVRSEFKSQSAIDNIGSFSGGDVSIGFTMKFGDVIEHPMNANKIPMGEEPGFLGRVWQKLFHPNAGTIQNN